MAARSLIKAVTQALEFRQHRRSEREIPLVYVQSSNEEDETKSNLLRSCQLQFPDFADWEDQDKNVERDVDYGIAKVVRKQIETSFARSIGQPVCLDGYASKDT
jgi:hypothetical protein